MADHDELCDYKDRWDAMLSVQEVIGQCPGCTKNAKVRANERRRITNFLNVIGQPSCGQLIEVYARQVATNG